MNKQTRKLLSELVEEASEYLDQAHQGIQWPDPIAWDGRQLVEQAADLCVLLDAMEDDEYASMLSTRLHVATRM